LLTAGLDIATHLGLALVGDGESRGKGIEINLTGSARLHSIAAEVKRTLEIWRPELVVAEGYAFCRNIDSFVKIVEVGTVVKMVLYELRIPYVDVSPTLLKKWTTGYGHADKEAMAEAAFRRWGFTSLNTDVVDAYALGQMGQLGAEELIRMTARKPKKKKKSKGVSV
jgi:crossover junction endodeoxyribonuclease RuvC